MDKFNVFVLLKPKLFVRKTLYKLAIERRNVLFISLYDFNVEVTSPQLYRVGSLD